MKESFYPKKQKNKNIDEIHLKTISRELNKKKYAYNCGRKIARKWIKHASYQEIKDALPRPSLHHDTNYFALMRNIYFMSIEKIYPNETKSFKWFHNVDFMTGWREEVILLWNTQKQ